MHRAVAPRRTARVGDTLGDFSPPVSKWKINRTQSSRQTAVDCNCGCCPVPSLIQSTSIYSLTPLPLCPACSQHWGCGDKRDRSRPCPRGANVLARDGRWTGPWGRVGTGALGGHGGWGHLKPHHPSLIRETVAAGGQHVRRPRGRNEPGTYGSSREAGVAKAEWMRLKVTRGGWQGRQMTRSVATSLEGVWPWKGKHISLLICINLKPEYNIRSTVNRLQ